MTRIGMLTPSSNTVLEPVTYTILAELPGVTAHFSRFVVREIALSDTSNNQFQDEPMLAAAALLADADVDLIVWNGTSASWLGLEKDRRLCREIEAQTGIPATTSALAIIEAFDALKISSTGLVTPYTEDVSALIKAQYDALGYPCQLERYSGIAVNKEFAWVPQGEIRSMLDDCSKADGVEAVAVVCTNFNAASLVVDVEQNSGVPVVDSVSATVWHALKLLGIPGEHLAPRWGKLFTC